MNILLKRYGAIIFALSLIVPPTPLFAERRDFNNITSAAEASAMIKKHSGKYVNLNKNANNIYDIMREIVQLDDNKNSLVNGLCNHIEKGLSLEEWDAIVETLEYAESVVIKNNRKMSPDKNQKICTALDAYIKQILNNG